MYSVIMIDNMLKRKIHLDNIVDNDDSLLFMVVVGKPRRDQSSIILQRYLSINHINLIQLCR